MLRSIIAIWTLALSLLVVAATSGCDLNGCANGDSCDPYAAVGPDMSRPSAPACATSCGTCAANEICFQGSGAAELPSFCARTCADERDCGAGETCMALFAALQPSVCVSQGKPQGCGSATPGWHCDLAPAACKDANTAQIAVSDTFNRVCGWEIVHCANGCANGACL